MRKVDNVTVQIDAKTRSPHLQELLGVMIAGTNFWIVPDHIWHDKDPTHFANSNPVVTGPYTLKRADPHGNWVLWERRANWARSDVGMMYIGRPEPRYVLYRSYGSEQERVAAMLRNDLDIAMPLSKMAYDELKAKSSLRQRLVRRLSRRHHGRSVRQRHSFQRPRLSLQPMAGAVGAGAGDRYRQGQHGHPVRCVAGRAAGGLANRGSVRPSLRPTATMAWQFRAGRRLQTVRFRVRDADG